jgi:hypothetical protein
MGSFRQSLSWSAIAFCVTLAVIVGVRLDQAALTVVVGVACGVGASIPTGLLVVLLLRRREATHHERYARSLAQEQRMSPPVVVVAPSAPQLPASAAWQGSYGASAATQREFAVIGEEGLEDGFSFWQEQG